MKDNTAVAPAFDIKDPGAAAAFADFVAATVAVSSHLRPVHDGPKKIITHQFVRPQVKLTTFFQGPNRESAAFRTSLELLFRGGWAGRFLLLLS